MKKSNRTPTAIVIGAPRSGTTSLFFYLKQHPEIFIPGQKELHYFTYDLLAQNAHGPGDREALESLCPTKEDYLSHYENAGKEKLLVEISPSYLYYSEVSERIHSELGEVKIIALLRNPVEKAHSQYMHLVRLNREKESFNDGLALEEQRSKMGWSDIWRYAESSLYADRIKKYISIFGKSNVKIILSENFFSQPEKVMHDLFTFFAVNTDFQPDTSTIYNRAGVPRSKILADFFARPNTLKSILKKLIPEKIRVPIRMAVLNANSGEKLRIDLQSKTYLHSYFYNDITEFERIIGQKTGWLSD